MPEDFEVGLRIVAGDCEDAEEDRLQEDDADEHCGGWSNSDGENVEW